MSAESPSSFPTYLGKIEATLLAGYVSACDETLRLMLDILQKVLGKSNQRVEGGPLTS